MNGKTKDPVESPEIAGAAEPPPGPAPEPADKGATVIVRRPGPSQGQRILNRLLAARSEQLTAVVSIDRSLAAMRKGAKPAAEPAAPRPPETTFFDALEQLAADFEQAAKRMTGQAQELRERF